MRHRILEKARSPIIVRAFFSLTERQFLHPISSPDQAILDELERDMKPGDSRP